MPTSKRLWLLFLLFTSTLLRAQTDHFASFNGIKLHYITSGQGPTTVVLVHGWACDAEFWREQVPALSAHWRVVAVDLPGFGRSDKPHVEYTQQYLADGLNAILEDAHITRAYLIGHSLGGSIVRQYAQDHPGHVAALVMVDSRSLLQGEGIGLPFEARKHIVDELSGTPEQEQQEVRSNVAKMFTEQTPQPLRQEILTKMLSSPPYVAASAMRDSLHPPQWSQHPTTVPTLALYRPLQPDAVQALRSIYPNVKLFTYPGAGHFLMLERPREFNERVITFLLQQDQRAPAHP